ncbi:hypothetical protein DFH07DRAFT_783202 [Mycena maculata]|uniref:Uncharacterized protein n=1 Tax=Mycena maculata TaxID=230809 RepID=A0AAD7MMV9_9AGAR|nr:hypothetical protein DFH07DRAFT_783202 [Mycena maculata]
MVDGLPEECEVIMHNGSVQRSSTTFLQTARPLDFHVRMTLFETDRPGYTERRPIDLSCVGPNGWQTERDPTLSQALLGVRRLQQVASSPHLNPFREDILLRLAKAAPVDVGLHTGQDPCGAALDSGTGNAIVYSGLALGDDVRLNSGDSQLNAFLFGHVLKVVVVRVDRRFWALSGDGGIRMVVRWVGCASRHGEYVECEAKRHKNRAEMQRKVEPACQLYTTTERPQRHRTSLGDEKHHIGKEMDMLRWVDRYGSWLAIWQKPPDGLR